MKYLHIKFAYVLAFMALWVMNSAALLGSSHREAPLIANDPLADNTDVYAFRSPDDPSTVTIIANYVPLQLPHGGPNYYQFGENIRYEIHIDNDISTTGDDIIYRFTFSKTNGDPTTFFNIRLGAENLQTTYTMERSTDGGASFSTIISSGVVPPYNIGERSIETLVGLGSDYETLFNAAINTTSSGEKVFAGPVDDPFFVDLGGIFDLGDAPRQGGIPRDGVSCLNVSTIAIQVPISMLQKDGKNASQAANILDPDFVIGVWASASRQEMRTLNSDGTKSYSGNWIQVSRLGMPLTNEAVIPIGDKDEWNARTPYNENPAHYEYFFNPELGLYMDDALFGTAVPAFSPLRIQRNSLGSFDFGNGNDGLFGLKGSPAVAGTALDDAIFGTLLLPAAGKPRSVDLWPAFHTGVPNLEPYQLATGKGGNPLATGKPFINNFLPNGGDMLRLNMAVPVTNRTDPAFSSNGLITAAVLGLTDPTYTATANLEFIPNMDGFPNGRRLEDDVTRIELQAVSGVVLAAIGLWYDDFDPTDPNASPVTQDLLDVLTYSTGVESNDASFRSTFPYVQLPWRGTGACGGEEVTYVQPDVLAPTQSISDFTIVNAKDEMDVRPLMDGDTIDLSFFPTQKFNIRVNTNPYQVGSVRIALDGDNNWRTDEEPPYAVAEHNDNGTPTGDYHPLNQLDPGTYTLTATPYSMGDANGIKGVSRTINFTIIESDQAVVKFKLINAMTDVEIGPLMDGDVVDVDAIGTDKLSVVAVTNPGIVGSVRFKLNGKSNFNTDSSFPYSLGGDDGSGDFDPVMFNPGTYKLKATPYMKTFAKGDKGQSLEINFSVISTARRANVNGSIEPVATLYPNPTEGSLTIYMPEGEMGPVSVQVIDMVGKNLHSESFLTASENWTHEINLSNQAPGMYFVKIINGSASVTKRVIKR